MPSYTAPVQDLMFVLHDVLNIGETAFAGYEAPDRDTTAAILSEAARFAETRLAPLNRTGDRQGCTLDDGEVRTPDGFRAAFDEMRSAGWPSLACDPAYGGQGLPHVLNSAVGEIFSSANMAFHMYAGLTHGAYNAIHAHGTETQKALYLPRLARCDWGGTMNLTEPQCGTDLGLIRTRAEPGPDDRYRITGQKIWISAGEHDLTDNIVHLVLARLPDAPEGVRGLSLFIVPKWKVADGSLGARNAVRCIGLESKMGIHGSATCVMQYDGADAELLGEAGAGLHAMFTMMNQARLAVGMQGYAQASAAYQTALGFARERLQGRAVGGAQNPGGPADPILVHPDVRRNLMDQKAFVEGARALVLWGASLIDAAQRGDDREAAALLSLLTPVIKGFLTDKGFEATVQAQQTAGGAGFVRETGLEQFVRDGRVTMIYEGTNGIQALDLVARKLAADKGRAFAGFCNLVRGLLDAETGTDDAFDAQFLQPLGAALTDLQSATGHLAQQGATDPEAALSGSYDLMHLFGHVCLGLMWTRTALAARARLHGAGNPAWFQSRIDTGRHYMSRHLPATRLHLARIESGAGTVMALDADAF